MLGSGVSEISRVSGIQCCAFKACGVQGFTFGELASHGSGVSKVSGFQKFQGFTLGELSALGSEVSGVSGVSEVSRVSSVSVVQTFQGHCKEVQLVPIFRERSN